MSRVVTMQEKLYDLTNPQKSIWYTEEVLKGTTVNNICTSGVIYEKVNEELLKKAINNVVKQHDSFRIRIVVHENKVKQYISKFKNFDIEVKYINKESELKEIEEEQAKYKFNILDSDLFKFKIVILKNRFACVILTVNHIISDSWSMGLTIQEILRNYHDLQKTYDKIETNINIEENSYINYINSEINYKNSIRYEKDKAYWKEAFKTLPEQATIPSTKAQFNQNKENTAKIINENLTGNNINDKNLENLANRYNVNIDKLIVNKIRKFCSKNNFSVFNFFMAIFSIYIGRVSNTKDFAIGTPVLNRDRKSTRLNSSHRIASRMPSSA